MAGIYYWYPKATGRMLSERIGRWQWLALTLGSAGLVVPMMGLGILGQRRRVDEYTTGMGAQQLHILTAVAGIIVFAGLVLLAVNIVRSLKTGAPAGDNPWEARTLEWQVSSPPPENNFAVIPRVVGEPHAYGIPGAVHAVVPGRKVSSEGM